MKVLAIIILLLGVMAFNFNRKKDEKKIIFFGDSITEQGAKSGGYIKLLEQKIKEKNLGTSYALIGAGVGGNKIYDLYLRMDKDVLAKDPDAVVIWIGVNDVWHKQSSGTGTDANKFVQFYNAIIQKLKEKNIPVYLCTPSAIGEKTDVTNELDGDLNKYAALIRTIAKNNNYPLIDMRKLFLEYNLKYNTENKDRGILTTDGVHLNDKGNELVAEEMMRVLSKSMIH
ncbi:MAG: GDSL-type esterase/lipase family protein [Chitinophagaceae bacterium]